jgi:hypothetical protein
MVLSITAASPLIVHAKVQFAWQLFDHHIWL